MAGRDGIPNRTFLEQVDDVGMEGCPARLLLLALTALLAGPPAARAQSVDTIVTWNRVLLAALTVPGANPPTVFGTGRQSITSIAVFDAVNSFDRRYHPYAALIEVAPGASRDAAAAAKAILEWRTGDGWEQPFSSLDLPSLPGYWKPTPPANLNATFTNYPYVKGFVVENGRRFLMEGPPAMSSERYATDFNEAKTYGAVGSTLRNADQTQVAQVWAGVGTSTQAGFVWNLVFGDLARSRALSGAAAARGFALLNMAQHDARMTSFTTKFIYLF